MQNWVACWPSLSRKVPDTCGWRSQQALLGCAFESRCLNLAQYLSRPHRFLSVSGGSLRMLSSISPGSDPVSPEISQSFHLVCPGRQPRHLFSLHATGPLTWLLRPDLVNQSQKPVLARLAWAPPSQRTARCRFEAASTKLGPDRACSGPWTVDGTHLPQDRDAAAYLSCPSHFWTWSFLVELAPYSAASRHLQPFASGASAAR